MENESKLIRRQDIINAIQKGATISNKAMKRILWKLGFSASGFGRKKQSTVSDDEYPGPRNRPHRDMRDRLARFGHPYGDTEHEATTFAIWLRRRKDFQCAYCLVAVPFSMEFGKQRHVDHFNPLSVGGRHETGNLVPSCTPCNRRKGSKAVLRPEAIGHLSLEAWKANPRLDPK